MTDDFAIAANAPSAPFMSMLATELLQQFAAGRARRKIGRGGDFVQHLVLATSLGLHPRRVAMQHLQHRQELPSFGNSAAICKAGINAMKA